MKVLSVECTIVLPEECLGHGPVVPFPAYGFAALVSHNYDLNSLNRVITTKHAIEPGAFRLNLTTRKVKGGAGQEPSFDFLNVYTVWAQAGTFPAKMRSSNLQFVVR